MSPSLPEFCRLLSLMLLTLLIIPNANAEVTTQQRLTLDMQLDGELIATDVIGYRHQQSLLLPLGVVVEKLGFPIELNPVAGSGRGWTISRERDFELDINSAAVTIDGSRSVIPANSVYSANNEIYVELSQLSNWFPIDFSFNQSRMRVELEALETLPIQTRHEGKHPVTFNQTAVHTRQHALPYPARSLPTTDLSLDYRVRRHGTENKPDFSGGYALITNNELPFISSEFYLRGDESDLLDGARLSVSRTDANKGLLGPLRASRIKVGDLNTVEIPLYEGGNQELGIKFENSDLEHEYSFDTTDFRGDLLPNWEVELYRNNLLIGYLMTPENGRYVFSNIPLYYGNNDFELIFYGPNGQIRRISRSHFVGPGMLQKGKAIYQFSLSEQGEQLFDLQEDEVARNPRLSAKIDYGLNDKFSLGAALHSVELGDRRHHYLNLGLRGALPGIFASLDTTQDSRGGGSYRLLLQKSLRGINLRASLALYDDFITEESYTSNNHLKSITSISASGQFAGIPIEFTLQDRDYENHRESILSNTLTAYINSAYLSHDLRYIRLESTADESEMVEGTLQLSKHLAPLFLRGRLDYSIYPDERIDSLFISALLNLEDRLSMNFDFTHNIDGDDLNHYSAGINWRSDALIVTPSIAFSSDGDYTGMVSANLALGYQPIQDSEIDSRERNHHGTITATVFEDSNNNGTLDSGERGVAGVSIRGAAGEQVSRSDRSGHLYMTNLPTDTPIDIELDIASIKDAYLLPQHESHTITLTAGKLTRLDFPLTPTGEIDGTLLLQQSDGNRSPLPNVVVELFDANNRLVQRQRSAFDGFYRFYMLPLGEYNVKLVANDAMQIIKQPTTLAITDKGTTLNNSDIILGASHPKATQTQSPGKAAATTEKQPNRYRPIITSKQETTPITVAKREPQPLQVKRTAGKISLQLGSFSAQAQAERSWKAIQQRHPTLTQDLHASINSALINGSRYYRITTKEQMSRASAEQYCARFKAAKQACVPALTAEKEPSTVRKPDLGGFTLQLGSYTSHARAESGWSSISEKVKVTLKNYSHRVLAHTEGRVTLYRLTLAPGGSEASARDLCNRVKGLGQPCLPLALK
ncbi:SPOR domain-containing protein [Candidatus Reidiella endopervernicosa]|nr:SPOR domain-containing protein [Candidatus Reidiella endopervernicosa]QKQ27319.1 SPOR domain-containing protein [Candidatus Reidiella endopervernicosa]